jgi:hypothetical protein
VSKQDVQELHDEFADLKDDLADLLSRGEATAR